jgi:heptose I phosphotransferase
MYPALQPLLLLAAAALLAGAILVRRGRRSLPTQRGFVELAGPYRSLLRELQLTEAEDFLALDGAVVSGHPGRDVARLRLGGVAVYLKREYRVSWSVRLRSYLAGFGLVSRALREARILQALQREGLPAPEWIATGEDGYGRAFLVVRAVSAALEIRNFLRVCTNPERRRQAARMLGRELARLHDAGFAHPDLYAKHVLIDSAGERVWLLDWQRSKRGRRVSWATRRRNLAALHATLADDLATPQERLACLHAYLPRRPRTSPKRRPRPGFMRVLLAAVSAEAARLQRHRHISEKRQSNLLPQRQEWRYVEGPALCVTAGVGEAWLDRSPGWLSLERQPDPPNGTVSERWLPAPGTGRALLVRRKRRLSMTDLWNWLRGRPLISPEERQAALLFRLQRHAVPAPRVLAMGQRRMSPWQSDSFLLTAHDGDSVRLDTWLSRPRGAGTPLNSRRRVLREAGALLHRMHEASCYLGASAATALAVRPSQAGPTVVLARPDLVEARRRPTGARARRDLAALERSLLAAGGSRTDQHRVHAGYEDDPRVRYRTDVAKPAPGHASRSEGDATMTANPAGVASPRLGGFLQRLTKGVRRLRERPEWLDHVGPDWADGIMDVAVTDRFHAKQGRSTGRWVLPASEAAGSRLVVYLKRHYTLPWWQRLLATFWPRGGWSPAMQEWRHLEWARAQGVPVPEALAAAEFIGPGGILRSFLAVKELTDMLPLNEAMPLAAARLGQAAFRRWKRSLAAEMARLSRLLHDRHCFHKDLYFCHFYIARGDTAAVPAQGWKGRIFLIDLHRLAHHPLTWRIWQTKDLAQLLYSSDLPGVDARDRLSFWRAYRGPGPRRVAHRWLRSWVLFKWGRYRRHNARRKARAEAARTKQAG